jgi:hypothetical protein
MQPLAGADQSNSELNMNLSRSSSLTILDQNGDEISIETNLTHPIELIISRDPNLVVSSMTLQNVISTVHNQLFHLQYINITNSLAISVHFEIHPLDMNVGYLFIYKFDGPPQLNSSINETDGWTLFCPSSKFFFMIYSSSISLDHRFDK